MPSKLESDISEFVDVAEIKKFQKRKQSKLIAQIEHNYLSRFFSKKWFASGYELMILRFEENFPGVQRYLHF